MWRLNSTVERPHLANSRAGGRQLSSFESNSQRFRETAFFDQFLALQTPHLTAVMVNIITI